MGGLDTTKSEDRESLDFGFAWGRRMRVSVHKTGGTSRRSQGFIFQRRDVEIQRHDMKGSL